MDRKLKEKKNWMKPTDEVYVLYMAIFKLVVYNDNYSNFPCILHRRNILIIIELLQSPNLNRWLLFIEMGEKQRKWIVIEN